MKKICLILFFLFFSFVLLKAQNTITDSIYHQFSYHHFIVHTPPQYHQSKSLPLLIVLHGEDQRAEDMERYSEFNVVSDSGGFIVVYPEMQWKKDKRKSELTTFPDITSSDINYCAGLLDSLQTKYNIDEEKIYVAGFSKGGLLAQILLLQLHNKIAASASVASLVCPGL